MRCPAHIGRLPCDIENIQAQQCPSSRLVSSRVRNVNQLHEVQGACGVESFLVNWLSVTEPRLTIAE